MNDEYKWKLGHYRKKSSHVKIVNFHENRINITLKFAFFKKRFAQTIYYLLNRFGKIKKCKFEF